MTVEGLAKGSSDRTKLTTLSSIVLDFADYAKGNFAQPNDSLYFNMPGLGQLKLVMRLTPHVDGETEADMAKVIGQPSPARLPLGLSSRPCSRRAACCARAKAMT